MSDLSKSINILSLKIGRSDDDTNEGLYFIISDTSVSLETINAEINNGDAALIIENLTKDIPKKIRKSNFKFYILGYDEKGKQVDPLTSNKFDDNRIDTLTEKLKKELKIENIHLNKVPIDENSCILILLVKN